MNFWHEGLKRTDVEGRVLVIMSWILENTYKRNTGQAEIKQETVLQTKSSLLQR
jgi:hypothetical protein